MTDRCGYLFGRFHPWCAGRAFGPSPEPLSCRRRFHPGKDRFFKPTAKFAQREEIVMPKTMLVPAAAVAMLLLLPMSSYQAAAQSPSLQVNAVDIDVAPGQINAYLAAAKENGAATVKEPGCHEFDITVSQKDPNHVLIIEVYDDAAAAAAHRETDHFKKYAAATKELIAKREPRIFSSAAMNLKGQ
jgi:quinol monooxygenase YgiN